MMDEIINNIILCEYYLIFFTIENIIVKKCKLFEFNLKKGYLTLFIQ